MTVHLVGAGPGDADLLTLRALRLLQSAEIVVHDRLIDASVLALIPNHVQRIDVGKVAGTSYTQSAINALLVDLGSRHDSVVRLKGGDPYLFGRGGEEAAVLTEHGIAWTITPGVTSALSAPAAAGIPVTHRGVSAAVTVVTGHRAIDSEPVNWPALAQVGGTIVVLMGVERRGEIADELILGGLASSTPVAVIERAWTHRERVVRATLGELVRLKVASPATIVIGEVASINTNEALLHDLVLGSF